MGVISEVQVKCCHIKLRRKEKTIPEPLLFEPVGESLEFLFDSLVRGK